MNLTLLASALVVAAGIGRVHAQSYTTCTNPAITWYNNRDGLNPCEQYQTLRRICEPEYNVPVLFRSSDPPPDTCNSECCCNSVAFGLSVLCLNCQRGIDGINAGPGTYQRFLNTCGAATNNSLSELVQQKVCASGLRLSRFEYNLFWPDGSWFIQFTQGTAVNETAAGDLEPLPPNQCPVPTSQSPSSTGAFSSTSAPANTASSTTTTSPSAPAQASSTASSTGGSGDVVATSVPKDDTHKDSFNKTALIVGIFSTIVAIGLVALISRLLVRRRRTTRPGSFVQTPPMQQGDIEPFEHGGSSSIMFGTIFTESMSPTTVTSSGYPSWAAPTSPAAQQSRPAGVAGRKEAAGPFVTNRTKERSSSPTSMPSPPAYTPSEASTR